MEKANHNILAINPGSRYLGIAVLHNSDLREWTTKVLSTKPLTAKKKEIKSVISEYLNIYSITVVALKQLHPSRSSEALGSLVAAIRTVAQERRVKIVEYSIGGIKQKLISNGKQNKKCLMDEIVLRYPYLHRDLERERKHKNPYLIRMFEAVALGTVCWNELDSRSSWMRSNTLQ